MIFDPPLTPVTLLRRYKRFLADVRFDDGRVVTVHVPNTGSMLTCADPGSPAFISTSDDPKRKYPHTLELVTSCGVLAGINTSRTNSIVAEALAEGRVPELTGYAQHRREQRFGDSRFDFLLEGGEGPDAWVEVKNVTLAEGGAALFPDAVTARGLKHLRTLAEAAAGGARAVIFYLVQREDGAVMRPADAIDPAYGAALREVVAQGVEALAYQAVPSPRGVALGSRVPVEL